MNEIIKSVNYAEINVVDCSDVMMFISFVSLGLRKVVGLVELS